MKKLIALLTVAALCVCALAACGKTKPQETTAPGSADDETTVPAVTETPDATEPEQTGESETETGSASGEEPTETPPASAASLAGTYGFGRCTIEVKQKGEDSVSVEITWGASAFETSVWTMTGTYDPQTGVVKYTDCVKTDVLFSAETEEVKTVAYENGAGSFRFKKGSLTWTDEQENIADGMEFVLSTVA